jgi:hypothetical protein
MIARNESDQIFQHPFQFRLTWLPAATAAAASAVATVAAAILLQTPCSLSASVSRLLMPVACKVVRNGRLSREEKKKLNCAEIRTESIDFVRSVLDLLREGPHEVQL